jgi:predicted 3-demethylubiquinone-9 3-methyltransferase (glyoxalase superfamily)
MAKITQKITPCLWFDSQAEEAAKFYTSIFKNSKIEATTYYDEESSKAAGRPKGSVLTVDFQLEGQSFMALNGGPVFKFTEAVSFVVNCENQKEVDYFWEKLKAGGQEIECGWLKDKFGLSWQVVPTVMMEMLKDKDAQKSQRAMAAMLKMKKLDIAELERAYQGKPA